MPNAMELPPPIRALFQDCAQVHWDAHRGFIIDRVLEEGSWEEIRWLRSEASDGELAERILATRGRSLSARQVRFWQLILDLPADDVSRWLSDPSRVLWDRRSALIGPLVRSTELGCSLASIEDIAAMKLAAITQRAARKDFFDLVAVGRAGFALVDMLAAYRSKFSVRDIGHVLVALTWFDDAEGDADPVLLASKEDWTGVKATLRGWVREHASR